MIKKIIASALIGMIITSTTATNVLAADLNNAALTGSAAVATTAVAKNAYELSVIERMAGRCGAATQTGAKGIAFEVLYTDLNNLKNLFKHPEWKTYMSELPNGPAADIYVVDTKTGNIIESLQLKNFTSTTMIDDTIKRVQAGQYDAVDLVGTKETAALYNEAAVKKGVTKVMKDSKIPTKYTEYIADRALGNISNGKVIAKNAAKTVGGVMVISGGLAFTESMINGDDAYHTAANVLTDVAVDSAITVPAEALACGAGTAIAAMGGSTIACAVPAIIILGGTVVVLNVVHGNIDENNYKELVANHIQDVCEETKGFACYLGDQIGEGVEASVETIKTIPSAAEDTCLTSAEAVCTLEERAGERIEESGISNIPSGIEDTCLTSAEAVCTLEDRTVESIEYAASTVADGVTGLFNSNGSKVASK